MSSKLARIAAAVIVSIGVTSSRVSAEPITLNIGSFSFDTFVNPDDPFVATTAFDVFNMTGEFALPPDFAATTALTFSSLVVTLLTDTGDVLTPSLSGVTLGPGSLSSPTPLFGLQFAAPTQFTSAQLDGVIDLGTFPLPDGRLFTADTLVFSTMLTPSNGLALNPFESAIITLAGNAADAAAPVPEPTSMVLIASGLGWLYARRRTLSPPRRCLPERLHGVPRDGDRTY